MRNLPVGWAILVLGSVTGLGCEHHSGLRLPADGGGRTADSGAGAGAGAKAYSGVIIATLAQGSASSGYGVFADFAGGPHVDLNPTTSSCACTNLTKALPPPSPDAGTLTLSPAAGGSPLATLVPATDGYHGSWDLGFLVAGHYASADSQAWNGGDTLSVAATGSGVHAFSGTIQVPALFSGVTPPLASAALTIDRARELNVTWTPEGRANESVLLILQQISSTAQAPATCYCTAPDTTAALTVEATILGQFSPEASGTARLERLIASTAACDNATVTLVGEVAVTAAVTFQ